MRGTNKRDFKVGDLPSWLPAPQIRLHRALSTWADMELTGCDVEHSDEVTLALFQKLARRGIFRYAVPREFGGIRRRVQVRDLCVIRETLAGMSPLADVLFAVQALAIYPLITAGALAQQVAYLPRLATGQHMGAFALTESNAGSDATATQLRARKRGENYVLNGVKSFISNAGLAHVYVVFGSTHPARRGNGISAFVVEAGTPGVAVRERLALISPHPIGTVAFKGCCVPTTQLLGKPGKGLGIALNTLGALRCSVGAAAVGMASRALAEAVRYAQHRSQFGRTLSQFQGIRFKVADMATDLEAARLLVYQAAHAHDQDEDALARKASMAKLFATEAAQRIVDQALQIHGGRGLLAGSIMERLYRDVRALRIYEGTSEIQRLIIARDVMGKS